MNKIINNLENNYQLIDRYNIDKLKLGMHLQYERDNKLFNGGIILKIENPEKYYEMTLTLKSNIIWKMKIIKYKVYVSDKDGFKTKYHDEIENAINNIKEKYKNKLNKRVDHYVEIK